MVFRKGDTMQKIKNKKTARKSTSFIAESIKKLYNKSAPLLVCEALLFGVVAVLMFIKPVAFLAILTFIIGGALVLFGLYRTIAGFITTRDFGAGWFDVLFGLLNVIIGVLFCIYPIGSMVSLTYIFVILFMFKALRALIFAINMARARFGHYWFDLIMSIILIIFSIILLVYPLAGAVAVVYYLAITLLLYAAADVYMYVELVRLKKLV